MVSTGPISNGIGVRAGWSYSGRGVFKNGSFISEKFTFPLQLFAQNVRGDGWRRLDGSEEGSQSFADRVHIIAAKCAPEKVSSKLLRQ